MKVLEQITIKNNSDIIYAKTTMRNLLRREEITHDESFLILALMELSTNLVKHAGGGEILILQSNNEMLLGALDYGKGIKDLAWSIQKGTTSMQNSLGLGLYQINKDPYYHIEIFTQSTGAFHGTIVLVKPRDFKKPVISLQSNYIGEQLSGDMFAKKGKFLLLADGSGHGRKANKSVEFVKSFFYDNYFSCLLIDEFFQKLHKQIQENMLRGVVLSLFEITKNEVQICGVGNIALGHKQGKKFYLKTQKDGILGEAFSSSSKEKFSLSPREKVIATTDGIDCSRMEEIVSQMNENISSALLALVLVHFASLQYDDKSVVVIENLEEETDNDARV